MPALHWTVTNCDCCAIIVAKNITARCDSVNHGSGDVCPECLYPVETPEGTKEFCRECKEREGK